MRHFRLYLWKEWREQRPAVFALLGLLPVLVLSIAFGAKGRTVGTPLFLAATAILALVVTLIAIGGELLGSERRAGTVWLERLPAGLAGAFPAKFVLFLLSSAAALAYGGALGALGALLRGKEIAGVPPEAYMEHTLLQVLLVASALLALWTFATSAWLTRGMLALCAGALLGAVFALPIWIHEHFGYRPQPWEWTAAAVSLAVAALASARAGFVQGGRGRSSTSTALRGGTAGALCVLPLWGWGLFQWEERDRIDLASPECCVYDAWVFGDGKSALVSMRMDGRTWEDLPHHVLRLDLENGTYHAIPGVHGRFLPQFTSVPEQPFSRRDVLVFYGKEGPVLDSFSGQLLDLEVLRKSGAAKFCNPAGLGWSLWDKDEEETVLLDPYHGRIAAHEIAVAPWSDFFIGPEVWWIRDHGSWLEYLPETRELVPAAWQDSVIDCGPMLADGRMLVLLRDLSYALVGPHGAFTPVSAPPCEGLFERAGQGFGPGEPILFDIAGSHYRLDEDCLDMHPVEASYTGRFLRCLPDGTLFFLTEEGIARREPDGTRRLVFSLADAREGESWNDEVVP